MPNSAEQNAIQALLQQALTIISRLSPVAKAIVSASTALITSLVNMAFAGAFNTTSIVVLAAGAVSSLLVYLIPNGAKKAVPPTVVPAKK